MSRKSGTAPRAAIGRIVGVFGAALLGAAFGGCASPTTTFPKLEARGELRLDASVRQIGVSVLEPGVPFQLREPIPKAEASATTAREAARETLIGGGEAAILFPASYVVGGLAGATFGVSEEKIRRSAQAIERAAAIHALPARASDAFLSVIAPRASVSAARIADDRAVPPMRDAARHASQRRGVPVTPLAEGATGSGGSTLPQDVDTVVGVRVFFHGFQVAPPERVPFTLHNAYNPPLQIVIAVSFTGLRVGDGAELGGISVHYTSASRTFTSWAADEAAEFRRELAQAQAEIAAAVAARVSFGPAEH